VISVTKEGEVGERREKRERREESDREVGRRESERERERAREPFFFLSRFLPFTPVPPRDEKKLQMQFQEQQEQ